MFPFQRKPLASDPYDTLKAPEAVTPRALAGVADQEVPYSLDVAPGMEMSIKVGVESSRIGSGFAEVPDINLSPFLLGEKKTPKKKTHQTVVV